MPGVPFSKGCATCKRRKVKCDEIKPECTQCVRLGKGPCPGYKITAKFIDESARFQHKRLKGREGLTIVLEGGKTANQPKRKTIVKTTKIEADDWIIPMKRSPEAFDLGAASFLIPRPLDKLFSSALARQGFEMMMISHLAVVHCGRTQNCLQLIPQDPGVLQSLRTGDIMPSFVAYIPQHLGKSRALDSVVDLVFTAAGLLTAPRNSFPRLQLMKKYGAALAELRDAILDPVESLTVEVLAACSLLSVYECINSTSLGAWINHHRGIYRLIQKRGPARFQTDFERQLLLASLGTVFTIALRYDTTCYLEQPEWQEVIFSKSADSIIAHEWTDSYRCQPLLCPVPRLVSSCREIVRDSARQTAERIEALVASAYLLRKAYLDLAEKYGWKHNLYSPLLAPRQAGQPHRVFCDAEDQRAENYCTYLHGLILVNRVIVAVRPSSTAIEEECQSAATEIQRLHSFIKLEPQLKNLYIIHSERISLAALITSTFFGAQRAPENGCAFDPRIEGGGHIIARWKYDMFDDIVCARTIDAPLMYHYPTKPDIGVRADDLDLVGLKLSS